MIKKITFIIFCLTIQIYPGIKELSSLEIPLAKLTLLFEKSIIDNYTQCFCSDEMLPNVEIEDKTNKLFIAKIERAPGSGDFKYYSFETNLDTQKLKKKLLTEKIFLNNTQVGWQITWYCLEQKSLSRMLRKLTE